MGSLPVRKVSRKLDRHQVSKLWQAYLDTGTLAGAAAACGIHPKTVQRYARRLKWKARREKILTAAADRADALAAEQIGQAEADAASSWRELLATATTRRALIGILKTITRK